MGNSAKKYQILREIGTGSFGEVYLALPPGGGPEVALKFLRLDRTSSSEAVALFKREFELLRELKHPNLANVLDFGFDEERRQYFFSAEYCPGTDLIAACAGRPLDYFEELLVQTLAALDHIHSQGVVHSDIKPDNLLVADLQGRPRVKLLDFGVAGRLSAAGGGVGGSPAYMAPELLGPEARLDPRADLYSLGVIALELLAGKLPFDRNNPKAARDWHLRGKLSAVPWRTDVPPYLRELTEKLLAKQPSERFTNARVVLNFLNLGTGGKYQTAEAKLHAELPLEGPLVERREELLDGLQARIKDFFAARASDPSCLCLLRGERGIGKTRILEELRHFLDVQEIRAVWLSCDWEVPSWPRLTEALDLPALAHDNLDKNWQLLRRVDALREAARKRPFCLLIDDFHKMEADFREAVFKLAEAPGPGETAAPLFLVAATEQDLEAALPLKRISPKGVLQYVQRSLGGDDRTPRLAELLHRYSGGLPLLMAEGLRYLAPRFYRGEDLEDLTPSPEIASLYEEKIRSLSAPEQELLELLALLFRPVPERELLNILALEPEAMGPLAKNLLRLSLLKQRLEAAERQDYSAVYELSSEALAASLIGRLPAARRKELHHNIAAGLETSGTAPLEERAYHWAKAGQEDQAVSYYEQAAAALRVQGQVSSANRCLAKAIEHSPPGSPRWEENLTELVRLHILSGLFGEAEKSLHALDGIDSWRVRELRGWLAFKKRDFPAAREHYGKALEAAPAEPPLSRILIENALANVDLLDGHAREAAVRYRQTLERERALPFEEQVKSNNNLGLALVLTGEEQGARSFYEERAGRWRGKLKPEEEIPFLNGRSYVALQTGRYQEAITLLKKAMQLAEQSGALHPLSSIMGNLVTALLKEGRYAESLPLLEKIVGFQQRLGNHRDLAYNLMRQGSVYLTLGMGEKAKSCFESGKRYPTHGDTSLTLWYLLVEGYWEREHGDPEAAQKLFAELETKAEAASSADILAWAVYAQADLACDQGRYAEARRILAKIQGAPQDKEFLARRHLLEAKLSAHEQGRNADQLFAEVESECKAGHYREILWEVYHDWGLSRERRDGPKAAQPIFQQGVQVVEAIVGSLPEEYRDRYLNQRTRKKLFDDWRHSQILPVTARIKDFLLEKMGRSTRH